MATATRNRTENREEARMASTVRPVSTIWQEDGLVKLMVEMPGITKDQVDVQVENDTLTIRGERESAKDQRYVIRERRLAPYERTYTLDDSIDRENIAANMEHGVLTLTLHLRDAVKPRRIEISGK